LGSFSKLELQNFWWWYFFGNILVEYLNFVIVIVIGKIVIVKMKCLAEM